MSGRGQAEFVVDEREDLLERRLLQLVAHWSLLGGGLWSAGRAGGTRGRRGTGRFVGVVWGQVGQQPLRQLLGRRVVKHQRGRQPQASRRTQPVAKLHGGQRVETLFPERTAGRQQVPWCAAEDAGALLAHQVKDDPAPFWRR